MSVIVHFRVQTGRPFVGRLACDRRVSAINYHSTADPAEVTCKRCLRTRDAADAAAVRKVAAA